MANDKKFIVKNGLLTQENVVIGTITDDGVNKLQVTGSTKLSGTAEITQSTAGAPSVNIVNTGGFAANSIIAQFTGDANNLQIRNFGNGDYSLLNSGQSNGIRFYNNTAGVEIVYNNSVDLEFSSVGIDFKREPTYNGFVFWNAGNDGANSGLDADLLDGLDSLQFLRSDQDDIMNGSLTITGNLTVNGTTTTVNTETILLADNIITLNSNYTGSAPSENSGIEVERGTLANATFIWNETTDKWEMAGPSQGLVLGDSTSLVGDITSYANSFILQAGGASGVSNGTVLLSGKRGATAADAGVAAFWNTSGVSYGELLYGGAPKVRSENAGAVTLGNQRILGSATVGTGSGGAYIYMDGAGGNGTIYSSAGEIGFLNSSLNYAIKVDTAGDIRVTDDIFAQRFIDANNNTYLIDADGTSVLKTLGIDDNIQHNGNTTTSIGFPAANQFEIRTNGTQRVLVTDTYTQSSVDVRAPRFVDSDNNSYYVSPFSAVGPSAVFNAAINSSDGSASIPTYSFTSATNTGMYRTSGDVVVISTAGVNRFGFGAGSGTYNESFIDVRAPRFVDSNNVSYYADFANTDISISAAGTINAVNANFYTSAATNDVNIGLNANERFNINVTDSQGYIRYYQDETDTTDHSVNFEIISTSNGNNRFNFNREINAGTNSIVGGLGVFSSGVYAPIYYDYNDENYYADFASTAVSIKFAGTSLGGNGVLATPTYSFVNDPNTGMYRYGADILGFSAGGNDEFRIYTTYTLSPGSSRAPLFYDSDNTAYYGNFASSSVMNTIGIDSDLFHNGDTDTKLSFNTDSITLTTANVVRLTANTTAITAALNTYAPRFYTDDYLVHNGDDNTYIGFNAVDTFGVWTNGANRLSINTTAITGSLNFVGPRFVDSDNNSYYAEPAASSVFNTLGLDSDLFHNGDTDTKLAFGTDSIVLNTGGTTRLTANNSGVYVTNLYSSGVVDATTAAYAPIYYDKDNNAYYADFANTGTSIVTAGKIGVGVQAPAAMVDINIATAMGPNPFAAGNQFIKLGDAGTVDFSIAGDNLRNVYGIIEGASQFVLMDSSANILLSSDAASSSVVIGDQTPTYTVTDNTSVIDGPTPGTPRTITNNKLHVNGSIQLNGNEDAIVFGRGTSTFLMDEELGFGWGGGFYMNEATTVKIRNDKALSTGGNITAGNMYAARYYDSNNNAYYVDPNSTSVMNRIDLDDYIRHNGDTDNYFGFAANDTFRVFTGNVQRFNVDNDSADFAVNVYAPRYYDSNNNAYYVDPASTSIMNRIDLDDYIRHNGDTDTYFGFSAADTFKIITGGTERVNVDNNSADFAVNVYAPRYYDSNDNNFYVDPASQSLMNSVRIGATSASNHYLYIETRNDYAADPNAPHIWISDGASAGPFSGEGAHWVFEGRESDRDTIFRTNGVNRLTIQGSGPVDASLSFRAPIFYDLNNTAFYIDPASTSLTNTMRANRYQVRGSTYFIDESSSDYGTIRVEGQKNSWAGYAIYDDWVFMSNGATRAGIYNDTNNEWALEATANDWTRLYANGVHQIGAENGYGFAPSSMRSPIFYDSNNTNYFADFAAGNTSNAVKVNGRIFREGYAADGGSTNMLLQAEDQNQFIWNTATNWGIFWATNTSASYRHIPFGDNMITFVGAGNVRAAIDLDSGDAYFQNEVYAGNYNLFGGNESIPLNPTYGSGKADQTLFDGTAYWEKRVTQSMRGSESAATTVTAEFVKNGDGPFASSYVLRTAAYRTFYSDFIEVEPGEEIYGEQWVKYISGSGGLYYYGIERFDKNKNPIAGNTGTEYFVGGGSNVTNTSWQRFSAHTTIPTTHAAYSGSDGLGVKYIRIRILMNYNAGGALREFGPPILKRTNMHSRVRTDQAMYSPIYYDANDNNYYLDPASISVLNDVRASIYYDRSDTTYYLDPASTGQSLRVRGEIQNPSVWINDGDNVNSYNENIRLFNASNGVSVIAFSASGTSGTPTTSILGYSDRLETRYGDAWQMRQYNNYTEFVGDVRATLFYDRNNTGYYADPASTSIFNALILRTGGLKMERANGDNSIWFNGGTDTNHVLWNHYYGGPNARGAAGSGGFDGMLWNTYQGLRVRGGLGGVYDIARFSTDGGGNTNTHYVQLYANNAEQLGTRAGYGYAPNSMRSPIFYDQNDTTYYGDFAGTTNLRFLKVNTNGSSSGTRALTIKADNQPEINFGSYPASWTSALQIQNNNNTDFVWISPLDDGYNARFRTGGSGLDFYTDGGAGDGGTYSAFIGSGSVRSSIFYDLDNTGYYLNLNGNSNHAGDFRTDQFYARGWFRNDNSGTGLYNQATAMHWYSDSSSRFRLYSTSTTSQILFTTAGDNARGYVYADNGNNIGFLNQAGNWALRTNGGTTEVYGALYADIMYDRNNGAYYVDPASTTRLNITENIGRLGISNYIVSRNEGGMMGSYNATGTADKVIWTIGESWPLGNMYGLAYQYGGFGPYGTQHKIVIKENGATYTQFGMSGNMHLIGSGNATGDFRAPVFYDNNDTGFYVDPNSTARLNTLGVGLVAQNGGKLSVTGGHGDSTIRVTAQGNQLGSGTTSSMHWWVSEPGVTWNDGGFGYNVTNDGGTPSGFGRPNTSYGQGYMRYTTGGNIIVYNTNTSGTRFQNMEFLSNGTVYANNYLTGGNSLRAPIFYDSNNTGYYVDPNGTSQMNQVVINGQSTMATQRAWVASNYGHGVYGLYSPTQYQHIWSMGTAYNLAANGTSTGSGGNLYGLAWAYNPNYSFSGSNAQAKSGLNHQLLLMQNGVTTFAAGSGMWTDGIATSLNSFRAPIFYDSNDTSYYFDGASVNSTRFEGVSNRTKAMMGLPGRTGFSAEYYSARPRITGDVNYWTGSMGWGTIDMNDIAHWGSGFIDSWSNPGNQPSGTSHWVGTQAWHYTDNGNTRYGWQLVGGPIGNLRFRQSWGGFGPWRTIPVLGVNDNNGAAMYASIYYDSDNTGFYCDPTDFTNLNTGVRATEIYARNWFRNDNANEGIYNQATGTHIYSPFGQYWRVTGNSSGSSMSLQLLSSYESNIRAWLHGSSDGTYGFLNAAGAWKLRSWFGDGWSPTLHFREEGDESWTGNVGNDVGKIEYHANRFYIVSGANSDRIVQFRRDGTDVSWIGNDGVFNGTATSARWADVAERYTADAEYSPGQVLGINLDGDSEVTLYQPGMPLAGAVSTNPGVRMNDMGIQNDNSKKARMNPFIALKGRIPVHVNGDVKKGQWVVADRDGKGRGVDYGTPGINSHDIIGIALSNSANGEVEVKV